MLVLFCSQDRHGSVVTDEAPRGKGVAALNCRGERDELAGGHSQSGLRPVCSRVFWVSVAESSSFQPWSPPASSVIKPTPIHWRRSGWLLWQERPPLRWLARSAGGLGSPSGLAGWSAPPSGLKS